MYIVRLVVMNPLNASQADLLQVADALGSVRLLLGPCKRGQQQSSKNSYNCDDNKQFNKRKSKSRWVPIGFHKCVRD